MNMIKQQVETCFERAISAGKDAVELESIVDKMVEVFLIPFHPKASLYSTDKINTNVYHKGLLRNISFP